MGREPLQEPAQDLSIKTKRVRKIMTQISGMRNFFETN